MFEILDELDNLIDKFNNTDFVNNMRYLKDEIRNNKLINTKDVKKLYENEVIHRYIENENILDFHIYYLNKEINKLINNRNINKIIN